MFISLRGFFYHIFFFTESYIAVRIATKPGRTKDTAIRY